METIRDRFINLAGEILTAPQDIEIELSERVRFRYEIERLLRREKELLI